VPGGRIGQRLPTLAAVGDCFCHAVVGLQDEAFGAVLAEVALLVLTYAVEGVEYMFSFVSIQAVAMDEACFEVCPQ